ncbi:hypothetical protein Pmani_020426 [Petrolisthes manimaculis]|uniref:Uncharacterized protein n=1 Tax=Petrolisthes manimaculis TaxID=1843537 RepID=A0AAE1PIS8_9EUCA|nr:hypothetical protein Pmani_020426 [Petrolisthes manimaculis]
MTCPTVSLPRYFMKGIRWEDVRWSREQERRRDGEMLGGAMDEGRGRAGEGYGGLGARKEKGRDKGCEVEQRREGRM